MIPKELCKALKSLNRRQKLKKKQAKKAFFGHFLKIFAKKLRLFGALPPQN